MQVIHITGASGSGKSTLGNKLKEKYGRKGKLAANLLVKDLDDLRDEFIREFYGDRKWTHIDERAYQAYIDKYVNTHSRKHPTTPLIFVGLNDNTVYGKNKNLYYNVHATHRYYIDIDDSVLVRQKCLRLFNGIAKDAHAMDDLVNDNARFIRLFSEAIARECDLAETVRTSAKLRADYAAAGYKPMTAARIFAAVSRVLDRAIG